LGYNVTKKTHASSKSSKKRNRLDLPPTGEIGGVCAEKEQGGHCHRRRIRKKLRDGETGSGKEGSCTAEADKGFGKSRPGRGDRKGEEREETTKLKSKKKKVEKKGAVSFLVLPK